MVPQDYDEDTEDDSDYGDEYDSFEEEMYMGRRFRGCAYASSFEDDSDGEAEKAKTVKK